MSLGTPCRPTICSTPVPSAPAIATRSHQPPNSTFEQPAESISVEWYTIATRITKDGDGTGTREWSIHLGNLADEVASWRELVRMGSLVQISTRELELGQSGQHIRSGCMADGTHSETQRMSSILGRSRIYSTYRRAKQFRPKPESTEGGRRVSVLRRQEGAPVLLG